MAGSAPLERHRSGALSKIWATGLLAFYRLDPGLGGRDRPRRELFGILEHEMLAGQLGKTFGHQNVVTFARRLAGGPLLEAVDDTLVLGPQPDRGGARGARI